MVRFLLLFVLLGSLSACTEHPYETDGHNSVQLPDDFQDVPTSQSDSIPLIPNHHDN